ncbi:XdhC family protein [Spirosoma fluviale]|uniref:Xanthine and CO dehydrogenase maturation factor, XdhC/CoxF family n=1 Tax=Spirosoma fluviale TaxID=1597977 RepID=A0A286GNY8_9BACT|nr:XdhC/CoxI family protein [Spirosoma fluviale]SOD96684.1 Xanthine and CO dehydrogenase maturation factor, XdhC/CoxF family [Spirosoma fluviale]
MKEISRIVEVFEQIDFSQRKAALATVVWVEGSSYRRPGARMLITDDGRWEGAISGGCLEGDALRKARQVMLDGQPIVVTYDTMDDGANSFGVGLGCNGIIDVLIEPITPDSDQNPVALLKEFTQKRDVRALATVLKSNDFTGLAPGNRFTLTEENAESIPGWLHDDMRTVFETGKPLTRTYPVVSGSAEVFIERIDPGIELIIFGAGYDVIPVAKLARELGWQVTVTDDCIAHLSPKRFPVATCVLYADRQVVIDQLSITNRTAAVLMSHNFNYDRAVLQKLLTTDVPYIGMLGPRKRFDKMQDEFKKDGLAFSETSLNRVHAPIGLDLGAETPDEIALSIMAEIKAFFTRGAAGFLKNKTGPIHERLSGNTNDHHRHTNGIGLDAIDLDTV